MSSMPISLARVSTLMQSNMASQSINSTQQQLQQVETEISTGQQVSSPSDNPASAAIIQQLQKSLNDQTAYTTNLQNATSQLSEADSSLNDLENLLQQATSTASANVGSSASASQRQGAAQVIQTLYSQAMNIGNTQFEGSYLYGGDKADQPPFTTGASGVVFSGSSTVLNNSMGANSMLAFQVNGDTVFGATTTVSGATDLTPAVSATTRLVDLGGATGNGVTAGAIQISNGTSSKIVNFAGADTMGDIVTDINNAGLAGVTASLNNGSLQLNASGGANISVGEIAGGSTAADLGVATPVAGGGNVSVTGEDLQAKVTVLTPLADLRGGQGIDASSGITVNIGGKSTTLNFSADTTIGDLVNTVNGAGLGLKAQINPAGTGVNIINTVQGAALSIGENGGTTASDLGLRTFDADTPLSQLNGGSGVGTAAGGADDFQVTTGDGASFNVNLSTAKTVQDALAAINSASGSSVTATLATTGNGIILTDNTGGAGPLTVAGINQSTAAADLGIVGSSTTHVITGTDTNAVPATGILADLAALQNALNSNDQDGITAAAQNLQNDYNRVTSVRGQAGAQSQELSTLQSQQAEQTTATQSLLSNLQDTDMTTAITRFTALQTQMQAELETQAQTLNMSLMDFLT
jgi:flagellar hook-associated protein 3 FlgL